MLGTPSEKIALGNFLTSLSEGGFKGSLLEGRFPHSVGEMSAKLTKGDVSREDPTDIFADVQSESVIVGYVL